MPTSKLRTDYPWTASPVIINAPMAGFAGPSLATAVTQAGGIGMIGVVNDMAALEANLQAVSRFFSTSSTTTTSPTSPSPSSSSAFYHETNLLPIGVGLLLFAVTPEAVLPVLRRHPPAIVWLFAAASSPPSSDYAVWAGALRAALPRTRVWVQVGGARDALGVVRAAGPDVLVLQGSDAGGHGLARGVGVVSLVPETQSLLAAESSSSSSSPGSGSGSEPGVDSPAPTPAPAPALVAAGGMVDGTGVAAALALGVDGVVLGTRFLAAGEADVHPAYRAAVLAARDGASATVRAAVFDELRGPSVWPAPYDGRALATGSYADWAAGVPLDVVRARYREAAAADDRGYASRAAVWAGAGVGLVNEVQPAAEIVRSVREGARKALSEALSAI